uniref:Uncharacterized protein n=1 Tax=Eucampia antarctica TaxID=49252 RepID=A0A7S2RKY6_9STRA
MPHTDLGGFGPKVEAFTFAISRHALEIVRSVGTSFQQHKNKKSAIILGEYALTSVLMNNDIGIDSLLKSYKGIDWKDQKNWHCNDNIHPTRENTYFGQSINPLEVIFHKPHWAGNPPVNKEILEMYMNFDEMSAERQKQKDLNRFMI